MNTLGANYLTVDTDQKFGLLDWYYDKNTAAEFQYVRASASIAAGAAVKISKDGTAAELTTTTSGAEPCAVGVAQVAIASGSHGWVFRRGGGLAKGISVLAAASAAADSKMYTTATAGVVNTADADLIHGLTLTVANGGAQARTECYAVTYLCTNLDDATP